MPGQATDGFRKLILLHDACSEISHNSMHRANLLQASGVSACHCKAFHCAVVYSICFLTPKSCHCDIQRRSRIKDAAMGLSSSADLCALAEKVPRPGRLHVPAISGRKLLHTQLHSLTTCSQQPCPLCGNGVHAREGHQPSGPQCQISAEPWQQQQ